MPKSAPPLEAADRSTKLIYRIDAAGRIVYVNEAWSVFARANGGEAVMPEVILGCDWLAAISDVSVRELYLRIIRCARAGTPVQFQFRCDAPDKRRLFTMGVALHVNGEVEFTSMLVAEEARPAVRLLQPIGPRSDRMVRVCSWCQKLAVAAGHWLPVEEAVDVLGVMQDERLPMITHGICEDCAAQMLDGLKLS